MDAPQDTSRTHPATDRLAWDPVYLHARREAAVILLLLAVCCAWSVAAGWYLGYETPDPPGGRAGDDTAEVSSQHSGADARVGPASRAGSDAGTASERSVTGGKIILGMPAWVFWSVFLPWIAVDGIAVWFCFFYMQNDPLDEGESGAAGLSQAGADQ